ncbi:hypothetical protein PVAG01_03968 [Phlyctema vagabunda]|uniref:Intradiol ring-cleavage dioxygenases domain-containing protein n=1 Tax=Phlyctema vagabunda TaxID=108571 RepID=A0ABR4PNK7_9HELO
MRFSVTLTATCLLAGFTAAHPGHDHSKEIEQRSAYLKHAKKDLSHCAAKLKARGIEARNIARRSALAKDSRRKRGINTNTPYKRDLATVLNTTHLSSVDYTPATDEATIFAGNTSCILSPEVTQGPYYVAGEYMRQNLTEDQQGVELILDTQVIDVNTCDPVTNAVVEIWACNSTGVYSGIVASGNGDSSDTSNLDKTFLRGLQPTDDDGVAQFITTFPGHYTSRATHFHTLSHFNGSLNDNGTYTGGYVSHVGQLFFDQDLITQVEATAPYNTNTQEITLNADDSVLAEEGVTGDPFITYSLLGEDVSEGVFGWVAFGIDLTNEYSVSPAATLTEDGGVASSSSGGGGPGGNSTGNSTIGGAPPS